MASGKESKRRRRAEAPAIRPAERPRRASLKVLAAAGLLACVAALAVGLAAARPGGSQEAPNHGLANARTAERLFAGIPQRGNVLGSPQAPVTLVEYVDLQCPYCKQFETEALPTILTRFVRAGKVKIDARVIAFLGPDSERGRAAALAAGRQNRLFELMELLYYNQGAENTGWLDDGVINAAAHSLPGLDARRLETDSRSEHVRALAARFDAAASADAVQATPTVLVGKRAGRLRRVELTSPFDSASVAAAIRASLPR